MPEVEANAGVGRAFVRREVLAKRREALLEAAPSRSQANLEIRVPARNRHEEYERNRDAAEIAALKARLQNHETLQSQWKLAQEELAVQKQARVTEAARMADRVSQLESEIESVSARSGRALASLSKQRRLWRVAAALTGLAALGFLFMVFWPPRRAEAVLTSAQTPGQTSAPSAGVSDAAGTDQPRREPPPGYELPNDPGVAMTEALTHLSGALGIVHGLSPEEVLRKASSGHNGCVLVWTGDEPSVVFGEQPLSSNSLAHTLENCAEAALRMR